jgi:hypothetical protein
MVPTHWDLPHRLHVEKVGVNGTDIAMRYLDANNDDAEIGDHFLK